ncbi:MAG: endonuclease I family protein [Bacillus sp. (in: firmicutes)]
MGPIQDMQVILRDLQLSRKLIREEGGYYDEIDDANETLHYYKGIDRETADPTMLFDQMNRLVSASHVNQLPYSTGTRNLLYSKVDLREDGNLRSIYSGEWRDAESVIEEDLEADRKLSAASERLRASMTEEEMIMAKEVMESQFMYNCEHVVPQSWFSKRNPMRGDLHHLFTCEKTCNSMRSNHPYYDFADYPEVMESNVVKDRCGKYEEGRFEPESGKGAVARATLYFLTRYPGEIGSYAEENLQTLLHWHFSHPVTIYEKHRNAEIYKLQKNRNPYIDFSYLAERVDFRIGF